ncbi:5-formyltetrahydrofolate cyclo-ligase [Colwellia psychrerythraea]|uniref:5-formyltetrahydrofolate cyclo-ligase n=1 Tax=Colwellia psychrerythraea (strain 34H / ATCC BAA-681) TaxID=167879 RepID=Q47Y04_COLP3|nr:5-formyltetrahydrofolate cyclo-ligase [Colwellia psychrerythraea]AAZ26937.1 5-formyltetrahydrofolate cyclo-ligase family protein [Colwellia psychrerythraea 34H]
MNARSQLRKEIRQRRNALSVTEQSNAAIALTKRLSSHSQLLLAKRIAIYLSNDGELSTDNFISWCWQNNKEVYLPVVHPFSKGNLLFLHYQQDTELVSNRYGILEPKLDVTLVCPLEQLDIICTPLVAFDNSGARLGMGGGFYDRSLAHWQQNKTYPLGLAHDCQLVDTVPVEGWDIPLPEIITPSKNYRFI